MTVHHPRYHKHREHRDARGARFAWALAWARGPIMNLELEQVLSQRLRRYLPRGFILVYLKSASPPPFLCYLIDSTALKSMCKLYSNSIS